MKLISCYIEGYGKIKQQTYSFQDGITTLCLDNGEGKTTLASFIKAMFYGLEGYREGSTAFCDREHFYPFDKGSFGGNLTFSLNGKTYRIERYFAEKSTKGDSLKVYCNGELTDELGEDVGRAVFGVDEEAFCRTVFIGSGEIEIKSNSSINAKLGSFLQGMDEDNNFDDAKDVLEKAYKSYKPDRKSKNPTERIPQTEREIETLRIELDNVKKIQNNLEGKRAQEESLAAEIEVLQKQIVLGQEENERRTMFEHYGDMIAEIERKEKMAQAIAARYPMGLPTEEETLAVSDCIIKEKQLEAQSSAAEFSAKDQERLASLENRFVRGIPTEEQILAAERDMDTLASLETEIGLIRSKEPSLREKVLLQRFAHSHPTQESIAATAKKVEAYKQAKKEYEETPEWLHTAVGTPEAKNPSKAYGLVAAIAALLCVGGVALLALVNTLVGGVVLAVGFLVLLADAFMYLNKKSNTPQGGTMSALNPEKQKKEGTVRELEDGIKAMLMPYGYHSGNGVVYDFAEMQKDVADYEQYLASEAEQKQALSQKQEQKQALEQKLTAFFRGYGLAGDTYIKLLSDLRGMVGEYYSLTERKNTQATRKAELSKTLAENRAEIDGYKRKYGLTELRTADILEDVRTYARLCREIEEGKAKAAAYKEGKGLSQNAEGERVDLVALQVRLTEKQTEHGKLEREIEADEMQAEKIPEKEAELAEAESRLKEYQEKYKLLKAAKEFLEKADGRLKDKYVKPIKDEFVYYAELLEKTLGERVEMNKNFEITFERNGAMRSEKHLSAGQRSLCALCFRLALIKNMYKDNLPFLILDDPFVTLDKGHMEKAKLLLTELSKQMQMVYFTCHESRGI